MKKHLIVIASFSLFLGSCDKESTPKTLTIPNHYDSTTYYNDALVSLTLRSQLNQLVNAIKAGRTPGTTVNFNTVSELYTTGGPSLKDATTAYYQTQLEGTQGYFSELCKASGNSYTPGTPQGEGGVFGGYLFDENGLEMEQLIEKGLFGALSYYQAFQFLNQPNLSNLNKALAIYGAHPSFPNTPTASKTAFPDVHMANYAARRSDTNNTRSFYETMKKSFIKAQAAIKGGSDYNKERNEAIADIKLNWEKVNAATIINYCHSIVATMSLTETSDAQKASALHAYGECVGFLHGWRQLPADSKKITDAEIDTLLALLLATPNQTPQSYKFITEPLTYLPNLVQVISQLKSIYQFSTTDIESFRNNYVSIQNR